MPDQTTGASSASPLPGPGTGSDVPAVSSIQGSFFPDSRARYLHGERKYSVSQLRDVADANVESIAARVLNVLRGERFPEILASHVAEFARSHGTKAKDGGWISALASNSDFAPKLAACIVKIGEELTPMLQREEQGGFLRKEDLHLDAMLQRKKPSRVAIMALLQNDFGLNDGQRALAYGALVPVIKNSIAHALLAAGETDSQQSHQRTMVELHGRKVPFIHARQMLPRIAARFHASPTAGVLAHIEAVAALPEPPLVATQRQYAERLDHRFRWRLAMLQEDAHRSVRQLPSDGAHEKLCQVFDRLWRTPGIAVYFNYFGNEQAVMGRVLEGIRCGRIDLHCISCPDYSGRVVEGAGKWEFDFNSLGDGIGVVARKGFRYVDAWVKALQPAIPDVHLTHIMPTFEVPDGFQARTPEGVLSRAQAVERIQRSGEAITARYREMGVNVTGVTSDELIGDVAFVQQRMKLAEQMRQAADTDPACHGLLKRIFESRRALYSSWQARLDGESGDDFAARMIRQIVPNHAAEYSLVGKVLAARSPVSLILAYDSAIMGENYGFNRIPAMYGHDTSTVDYVGAQD